MQSTNETFANSFTQYPKGNYENDTYDKVRKDGEDTKSLQYLGFANIVAATWCPEKIV